MLRGVLSVLGLFIMAEAAHAVCENGMKETLLEPARLEHGKLLSKIFVRPAVYVERAYPAIFKDMTREEYDALPTPAIYMREHHVAEEIKSTPVDFPIGDLKTFDYVYWPDGTVATRKVETSYPRQFERHEILEPVRLELIETTFTRPEPIKLPSGRLRVIIAPKYKREQVIPGRLSEYKKRYVKSRTPAKYQLSFCES